MIDITEFPRTINKDLDIVSYMQYLKFRNESENPEKVDDYLRRRFK